MIDQHIKSNMTMLYISAVNLLGRGKQTSDYRDVNNLKLRVYNLRRYFG